ncbi:hypothetical protein QE152_g15729 [Popillia japonica]|uniref:C2H2-type domain-containing protein n=1 Tax=Popillia japonica TaxID=7064 RepID=A0AAW1L818_POPJA
MDKYQSKLVRELEIIIGLHVSKLVKVIVELNSADQQKWYDTLKEEINEACSLLVEEASLFVAVYHFRKTCVKVCKILQIPMLPYDCEEITLYEEKKLLESRMKEYEIEIAFRQESLEKMNSRQVELCKLLEKVPMTFIERTIPSESELKNLSNELEKLEEEYEKLAEEFEETRTKVLTALTELNLQMKDEIINIISSTENQSEPLSKERLQILQKYCNELQQLQKQEERKQLDSLKTTIDVLYDACHILESERKFASNIYNYSLDEIQTEINTLSTRLQENGEQFSLLDKYQTNWKKLAKNVEEFHKTSEIDTPVAPISQKQKGVRLINSTIEFEKKKKESFTTFGKTVPEIIAGFHDVYGKYYINDGTANRTLSNIITESKKLMTETVTTDLNSTITAKSECNTRKRNIETVEEANSSKTRINVTEPQDNSPTTSTIFPSIQTISLKNDAINPKVARLNNHYVDIGYLFDAQHSKSASQTKSTGIKILSDINVRDVDKGAVILNALLTKQQYPNEEKKPITSAIPTDPYKGPMNKYPKNIANNICGSCNRKFKKRRYLLAHLKNRDRNKNACKICCKGFRADFELTDHLSSHQNRTATEIVIIDGPEDVTEPVESVTAQNLENLVFSFESPLLTKSNGDISDITGEEIRTSLSICEETTSGNNSHIIHFESVPSSSNSSSESNKTITVNNDGFTEKRCKFNAKCKKKHPFLVKYQNKSKQSAESSLTPNNTKKAKVDVIQNLFKGLDLK